MKLGLIVEGHGDLAAVPILVRRIAEHAGVRCPPDLQTHRVPRHKIVKANELERAVELVARRVGSGGAILVVLDADDDCPAILGPELLIRATRERSDLNIAVVLAKREFEAWFLAAAPSLRGKRSLPGDLDAPSEPEAVRDAKGWLGARMENGYSETLDQPSLAALFDLELARRTDSFAKCVRDVRRLLEALEAVSSD